MTCLVIEFCPCGFGRPRGGTLPSAICLGFVRLSWGAGTLAEAITRELRKSGAPIVEKILRRRQGP